MSSGPRTVVGACMNEASAAPKVGYTNISDGATPLYHVGIFFRGLLRLSPLSVEFSPHSMRYAVDGSTRTAWGPLL